MTGGDNPPFRVDYRLVQGVEHSSGQLPGGAHAEAGVRVQRDDILHLPQPALLPRLHLQAGGLSLQQTDQLGEGPPLPLPAHVALIPLAEGRRAEKQEKAPAVFLVEAIHRPAGAVHPGRPLRPHGGPAVRQVGQDAQPQLGPRVPVGQAVTLQQSGQLGAAVLPGEEGHHHAQGAPLLWDASLQLHPGNRAGRHQPDQQKVHHIFHNIRQGQNQQQGGQRGPRRLPQGQGSEQGQPQHRRPVAHPGAGPLLPAQGLPVEIPAHVPPGALPLLGQRQGLAGGLALLQAEFLRKLTDPLPVAAAGTLIHAGVVARRVLGQHPLHLAGPLQKAGPLRPGQGPQGGEESGHLFRRRFVSFQCIQIAAQPGQPLHQRPRQGGNQQGQLLLRQRTDRLKALQIEGQPVLVQLGHRPQGALGAALKEGSSLRRPPEGPSASKSLSGPLPLPDGHIVVVQQPLHRSGQGGLIHTPGIQLLLGPAHLPQAGPERPGQGAAGHRPLQLQLPGGIGGVLL